MWYSLHWTKVQGPLTISSFKYGTAAHESALHACRTSSQQFGWAWRAAGTACTGARCRAPWLAAASWRRVQGTTLTACTSCAPAWRACPAANGCCTTTPPSRSQRRGECLAWQSGLGNRGCHGLPVNAAGGGFCSAMPSSCSQRESVRPFLQAASSAWDLSAFSVLSISAWRQEGCTASCSQRSHLIAWAQSIACVCLQCLMRQCGLWQGP